MTGSRLLVLFLVVLVVLLGGSGLALLVANVERLLGLCHILLYLLAKSRLGMTYSSLALLGCNQSQKFLDTKAL